MQVNLLAPDAWPFTEYVYKHFIKQQHQQQHDWVLQYTVWIIVLSTMTRGNAGCCTSPSSSQHEIDLLADSAWLAATTAITVDQNTAFDMVYRETDNEPKAVRLRELETTEAVFYTTIKPVHCG